MWKKARFGCFELDAVEGELRQSGRRIRLQTQPFRVLIALVSATGRVVTRHELKALIWPDDTFGDFDKGLNTAVMKIRQTLRDSAQSPRFLETVPKIGYRFLAPVQIEGEEEAPIAVTLPSTSETEAAAPATPVGKQQRMSRVLVAVCSAVACCMLIASLLWRPAGQVKPDFLVSEPLAIFPGPKVSPSFSPDGHSIAFGWFDGKDKANIYAKNLDTGATRRLTDGVFTDVSPVWSPDGKTIAFIRELPTKKAALMLVPADGGDSRTLTPIGQVYIFGEGRSLLAWSADGRYVVFSNAGWDGGPSALFLLRLSDGTQMRLTTPGPEFEDMAPALSPDGHHLAFVRYTGASSSELFLLDLSNQHRPRGEPRRLTFYNREVNSPAWTPDGRALLFTRSGVPGTPSLWRMEAPLSTPRFSPLPIAADNSYWLALSHDGARLVYSREKNRVSIWSVMNRAGGADKAALGDRQQWSRSGATEFNPQFSPDGKSVAYTSIATGHNEIWMASADGSNPVQLTHANVNICGFPRWSPDGRKIVFHMRRHAIAEPHIIDVATLKVKPLLEKPLDDFTPSWSHDGRWIYFTSRRSGTNQIWKANAEGGGEPLQVTTGGGGTPLESPDGKYLYFLKIGAQGLWRQRVDGGGEEKVFTNPVLTGQSSYIAGKNGIYFIESLPKGSEVRLAYFDLRSRKIATVASIPAPIGLGLGLSPDEKIILYSQAEGGQTDFMLVKLSGNA